MKITVPPREPEPYDAIVSEVWADEVAAGRGTEGQVFNNGHEFRVFSSLQAAVDSGAQNIAVIPDTYEEDS